MLLNEAYILNEKFSMDNWKKKDYDKIIDMILKEENPNLDENAEDCWEVRILNIPDEIKELILQDYVSKEIPKQYAYMSTYRENLIKKPVEAYDWGDVDAWYALTHPYARKYVEKFLMKEFKGTYHFIESLGNPMTLYRFIHFDYNRWNNPNRGKTKLSPEEFGQHLLSNSNIHLGVCWTPHFDKAEEFGYQEHNVDDICMIVQAKVNRDAVNLPNTLMKRSELTYYHYEDEIELLKGSPLQVEYVYFPPSSDKYFYKDSYDNIRNEEWFKKPINKQYKV